MVDSASWLHNLHDGGFNHMLTIVLNSVIEISNFVCSGGLWVHHWYLDFDGVVIILEIHSELVVHFEVLALWVLLHNLVLTKWNDLTFELSLRHLHVLKDFMERDFFLLVEEHQDTHLISRHRHLIFSCTIAANSSSYFSISLVQFPMELSSWELTHVILLINVHAIFNDSRNSHDIKLLHWLVLCRWISAFIWPMTCGEHFDVEVNIDSLAALALFEVLHPLLRHLNILVHDLKSLGKMKSTFFLQLLDHFFLGVFKNPSWVK